MKAIVTKAFLVVAIGTIVLLASESVGVAQCSMCRLSLAGSKSAEFVRNFNIGVLVLLIPPVVMFCSIFVVLRRFRDSDHSQ